MPKQSEILLYSDKNYHHIKTTQFLPLGLQQVFQLFEEPRNLSSITPPWLHFRLLEPDGLKMGPNAEINYTLRWLGLPIRWRTRITAYTPPSFFEDSQLRGPYLVWIHEHRFREAERGTWIEDHVRYQLPFGWLGNLTHHLLVRRQLRAIFEYRAESIERMLQASLMAEHPEAESQSR